MLEIDANLIARHAAPAPRYTSYPTALQFTSKVDSKHYAEWLAALSGEATLSLYVHIPYCHELCWYCGCNTKAVQRYGPIGRYLDALEHEVRTVAALASAANAVTNIHWGGGSPNVLSAVHIRRLAEQLRASFRVRGGAEFAVEIDPRTLSQPQVDAFADAGVNRISLGVQDFDAAVQTAINRIQSFDTTRRAVEMFRERAVASINIDLVYGLPHQTLSTAEHTIDLVLRLQPDRIAAFGYAHLPARLKHQRLIDAAALPDARLRFELAGRIGQRLVEAGYVRIGLDHFARPDDALACRPVTRNFQGYTTDQATALIGLGASAIGRFSDGYVQNATPVGAYMARIAADGLAVSRGLRLAPDDRMRAFVIEQLMCGMAFSGTEMKRRFGAAAEPLYREAKALVASDRDGLVEPTRDGFRITERGRPFVRSLCARFDTYLTAGAAGHAAGV